MLAVCSQFVQKTAFYGVNWQTPHHVVVHCAARTTSFIDNSNQIYKNHKTRHEDGLFVPLVAVSRWFMWRQRCSHFALDTQRDKRQLPIMSCICLNQNCVKGGECRIKFQAVNWLSLSMFMGLFHRFHHNSRWFSPCQSRQYCRDMWYQRGEQSRKQHVSNTDLSKVHKVGFDNSTPFFFFFPISGTHWTKVRRIQEGIYWYRFIPFAESMIHEQIVQCVCDLLSSPFC